MRIYSSVPGDTWTQQQKIIASDGANGDRFGTSVSISGDYVVIGDPNEGPSYATYQGAAYVFIRSGTFWTQQQKIIASDRGNHDFFGRSVSISGDYVIIGAEGDDDGVGDSGAAYVFKRSGTTWTEQQKLKAADGEGADYFGWSVSISGDYAVIGAYAHDKEDRDSGAAYVFKRSETTWAQEQMLTASDGATGDNFGISVSISGDYAIVGASEDDDGIPSSGSAYAFKRSGTTWTEQQKFKASDAAGDLFGISVSMSGGYSVIGAYADFADDVTAAAGAAYVFAMN